MWVIYDTDTGVEIDRVESYEDALHQVRMLNAADDYDHYGKRWED